MHLSRLGGLIIDCRTDDLDGAARFWSEALGYAARRSDIPGEAGYVALDTPAEGPWIEIQRVAHESGVHLDIQADDVEAEVRRLEALGARRVRQLRDWWVMEAPTGQRFCVVDASKDGFRGPPNQWPDAGG